MNKPTLLSLFSSTVLFLVLTAAPCCFAAGAHGGGGGGGFHGGGGGYHGGGGYGGGYHGGGSWGGGYHGGGGYGYHGGAYGGYHGGGYYGGGYWGGYRGGGYYPWRGGYGWGGGYYGYPGWGWGGWGFGVGVSFGWGGYAPAYPYYVYTPVPACDLYGCYPNYGYYAPVNGAPADAPAAYIRSSSEQPVPAGNFAQPGYAAAQPRAAQPRTTPAPQARATLINASYRTQSSSYVAPAGYRGSGLTRDQFYQLRPGVQNVIRALQAMPPGARVQQLQSGRYNNLSTSEMRLVRYAAGIPER